MFVSAATLLACATNVLNYVAQDAGVQRRVKQVLGLDPTKQAFAHALTTAVRRFEAQHSEAASSLFDDSFFHQEAVPILAKFLLIDGDPHPSELAERWADSLNLRFPARTERVREFESLAADFLDVFAQALKAEPDLRDLNIERAIDHMSDNVSSIRKQLGADRATPGTRRDYLQWIVDECLYLDPRGISQTHRQVKVRLDRIYVSLRAQHDELSSSTEQRILEESVAELDSAVTGLSLIAETRMRKERLLQQLYYTRASAGAVPAESVHAAEASRDHKHLAILGEPGSGKTTLLRYLALEHAQALLAGKTEVRETAAKAQFPVLIRIADFAESGAWRDIALTDFLPLYCAKRECPRGGLSDLLSTQLASGECLVLIDGLDEIVNNSDRIGIVQAIEKFVRRYADRPHHFVVTSRIAGYGNFPLGDPFVHYRMREMDIDQIRMFLDRWCLAVEDGLAPDASSEAREAAARQEVQGILNAIHQSEGVRHLASNINSVWDLVVS